MSSTTVRNVVPHDLPAVGELLDSVFRRPRGVFDQHMLTDFPLVFTVKNLPNCRVVTDGERIVSHAAIWPRELVVDGERLKVAVLVSVATDPVYRGRGYAAALVSSLQQTIHDECFDLGVLWTGVPEFYEKLGWERHTICGLHATLDAASLKKPSPSDIRIEAYDAARHLVAVARLHDGESLRMTRSHDEYHALLTAPKVQTWVAMRGDDCIAYLADCTACQKPGVREYGGELAGMAALMAHVVARRPEPTALFVYPARPDLAEWAQTNAAEIKPLDSSKGNGIEMLYPALPERLTENLRTTLFTWGLDQA